MNRVIFVVLISLLLQSCGAGMGDLRKFVNEAYRNQKPKIDPLPEIPPYEEFVYTATEDDDPFSFDNIESRQQKANVAGIGPDANRRKESLELYPLDALRMVGTLVSKDQPWVIIKTTEGTALRATVGNYIGQNEGQIVDILPDEQKVYLSELVLDPQGRWIRRSTELTIDDDG